MPSYNKVILVGHLTRDPELRHIPSGTAVAEVGLAVNDKRKDASGSWIEETCFVDITCWAKTAELVTTYLTKGDAALFEGRLKLDTWEQDGQKRSKLKVVADKVQFLGGKDKNAKPQQESQNANPNKFSSTDGGAPF